MIAVVIISLSRNINITRAHPAREILTHETRTAGAGSLPFVLLSAPAGESIRSRALTNDPPLAVAHVLGFARRLEQIARPSEGTDRCRARDAASGSLMAKVPAERIDGPRKQPGTSRRSRRHTRGT